MPVRPALTGLLKHEIHFTRYVPREFVLTLWTWKAGAIAGARLTWEQDQIAAWLAAQWAPLCNNNYFAETLRSKDFGTAPPTAYPTRWFIPRIQGSGASGSTVLDVRLAAVVALRTQPLNSQVRDRNNGRVFHLGLGISQIDGANMTLSAGAAAAIDAAYENLRTRLNPSANAVSGTWSVVSFFSAGGVRPVPQVTAIDHVLVRSALGVQRRRLQHQPPYARGA